MIICPPSLAEAAAIHLASPEAFLLCLGPGINPDQGQAGKEDSPAWQRELMHMEVQLVNSSRKVPRRMIASADLSISWSLARRADIPAAPDMIIVPAEGEGAVQSLGSTLLRDSQAIISEHLIEHLNREATDSSQSGRFLHMHISGWELYARQRIISSQKHSQMARVAEGHVKIVYHMTATGHYQAIVQQHFSRVIFSGLYDVVQGIYCFILGQSEAELATAMTFLQRFGSKIIIAGTSTNTTLYERFTLLGIREYLLPDDMFLYMHSKGLRHELFQLNMFDWSFYMMYFLIKQYPVCLRLLHSGDFDLCGVDFHTFPEPHFSGNFWWASAKYYLTLPSSIAYNDSDPFLYLAPEMYVGSGGPRVAKLWEANSNFHDNEYPPIRFVDIAGKALAWQGMGQANHPSAHLRQAE